MTAATLIAESELHALIRKLQTEARKEDGAEKANVKALRRDEKARVGGDASGDK